MISESIPWNFVVTFIVSEVSPEKQKLWNLPTIHLWITFKVLGICERTIGPFQRWFNFLRNKSSLMPYDCYSQVMEIGKEKKRLSHFYGIENRELRRATFKPSIKAQIITGTVFNLHKRISQQKFGSRKFLLFFWTKFLLICII